jgi:hypothetical protein
MTQWRLILTLFATSLGLFAQEDAKARCENCRDHRLISQEEALKFVDAKSRVMPALPPFGRIEGCVSVLVDVSRNGAVLDAVRVMGHPLLVESAKSAVMKWRFTPNQAAGFQAPISFWFSSTEGVSLGCVQ